MKITRDNYESWFLDFIEGNLEEGMKDEFIRFTHENPDLGEELHLFETVALEKPELCFSGKDRLLKEKFDLPEEFDETAVALLEGDLDAETGIAFRNYLQTHPGKNREIDLFLQTRLRPDLSIVFKPKKKLFHPTTIRLFPSWAIGIAAVLVLAMVLFPWIYKQSGKQDSEKTPSAFSGYSSPVKPGTLPAGIQKNTKIPATIAANSTKSKPRTGHKKEIHPSPPTPSENQHVNEFSGRNDFQALASRTENNPLNLLPQGEPGIVLASLPLHPETESMPVALSDKIAEKIGIPEISLRKIARWGLTVATELTNEKFTYATDRSGEITAYRLDTRLLGLSIPVKKNNLLTSESGIR